VYKVVKPVLARINSSRKIALGNFDFRVLYLSEAARFSALITLPENVVILQTVKNWTL
jgi:hypothetical protein